MLNLLRRDTLNFALKSQNITFSLGKQTICNNFGADGTHRQFLIVSRPGWPDPAAQPKASLRWPIVVDLCWAINSPLTDQSWEMTAINRQFLDNQQTIRRQLTDNHLGAWKITSTGTEGQKLHENLAPVLVIISGKSLVFSRKIITSTGFYRYCARRVSTSSGYTIMDKNITGRTFLFGEWIR